MSELRTLHTQIAIIGGHTKPIRGLYVGSDFLIVADEGQVYYYQRPYENEDSYCVEHTFKDAYGGSISCMAYSISHEREYLYLGTTLGGLNIVRIKTTAGRKTMTLESFFYVGKAALRRLQWLEMAKILVITAASPNIYMYVPLLRQIFSRAVSDKLLTYSYLDELTEALYVSDTRDYVKVFNMPLSNPGIINQSAAERGSSLYVSLYEGRPCTPTTSIIASVIGTTKKRSYFQQSNDQVANDLADREKEPQTLSTLGNHGATDDHSIQSKLTLSKASASKRKVMIKEQSTSSQRRSSGNIFLKLSNFFKRLADRRHLHALNFTEPREVGVHTTDINSTNVTSINTNIVVVTNKKGADAVYVPSPIAAMGMNSARKMVQSAHKKSVRIFLVDAVNGLLFTGGDDKVIAMWNIESLFISGESYIIDTSNFNYKKVTALAFSPLRLVLFSADESGAINVFDANNLLIVNTWLAHSGTINGIFLHDEAGLLYTYGNDGLIKIWRVWIGESECLAVRRN